MKELIFKKATTHIYIDFIEEETGNWFDGELHEGLYFEFKEWRKIRENTYILTDNKYYIFLKDLKLANSKNPQMFVDNLSQKVLKELKKVI